MCGVMSSPPRMASNDHGLGKEMLSRPSCGGHRVSFVSYYDTALGTATASPAPGLLELMKT